MKEAKFTRGEKCLLNSTVASDIKKKYKNFQTDKEVSIESIFTNHNDTTDYMINDNKNNHAFVSESNLKKIKLKRKKTTIG
jgi:metal-sulfur cluster biosynthetic enzyme